MSAPGCRPRRGVAVLAGVRSAPTCRPSTANHALSTPGPPGSVDVGASSMARGVWRPSGGHSRNAGAVVGGAAAMAPESRDRRPAQRRQVHLPNALTQTAAAQAATTFCTIEPNAGDVAPPEPPRSPAKIAGRRRSSPPASTSSTSRASCAARRRARGSATSFSPTSATGDAGMLVRGASATTMTSPTSRAASTRSPTSTSSRPS